MRPLFNGPISLELLHFGLVPQSEVNFWELSLHFYGHDPVVGSFPASPQLRYGAKPTKSDAILFGTPQRLKSVSGLTSVNVADSVVQLSGSVKILGATLDSSLTMGPHTKTLSKSCFHHIRSFRQIRSSMDHSTTVFVALALVSLRLDYVNSVLSGSPLKHIARLQLAHHALARVVLQERSRARSARG